MYFRIGSNNVVNVLFLYSTNRKSSSASKATTMSENVSIFKAYLQNKCV